MREGIVLIVGGGGREHALAIGLTNSESVSEIHVTPGNAGTSRIGRNHHIPATDIQGITKLAVEIEADLVVVTGNVTSFNGTHAFPRPARARCRPPK